MKIYKEIYEMRVAFPKGTLENAIAKIMLKVLSLYVEKHIENLSNSGKPHRLISRAIPSQAQRCA